MARPPAAFTAATVSSPSLSWMSTTTTAAPSEANRSADSRPMPLPAPVMRATLPSSRIGSDPFEVPPALPVRHRRRERALLGPEEVRVMLHHGVAERAAGELTGS